MSMEPERSSTENAIHNMIIGILVEFYEKLGFNVRADHIGGFRECPDKIGSYTPDLIAEKEDDTRVIEVETRGTIGSSRARQQLLQFVSNEHKVILAIPYECLNSAMDLRASLGIDFEILPCYPMVRYVGAVR
ncbi:MAG: hypothetical protein ACUVUU_08220 [bacterium]